MRNLFLLDNELAKHPLANIVFILINIALFGYWLLNPAQIALLMPDSTSYIDFQDYRGAGYPAFLATLRTIGIGVENVPYVQNMLFFFSLSFLSIAFNQRFRSLALSIALIIGIGLNPAIAQYNFSIITESLYFSSLLIFLAFTLKLSYQRTNRGRLKRPLNYVMIGLLFSWLILIKPVSWSFIAIPILIIWQHISMRENVFRAIGFLLIGFVCVHFMGTGYRYSVHQQFSGSSFFGNQLIGKLAFTPFDPDKTAYPAAGKLWLDIMHDSHEARKKLDSHGERYLFSLNTYDFLRFDNMPDIVNQMQTNNEKSAQKDLALSVLKQNPKSYAYDVGLHFYHLWSIGELRNQKFSKSYNKKLDQITEEFKQGIPKPYYLNEDGSLQVLVIKPFLAMIALLNAFTVLFGVFYCIRFKPNSLLFNHVFILACSVNAYFLLTALLQAALTRYAIVAWPMHLILFFGLITIARNKLFNIDRQIN